MINDSINLAQKFEELYTKKAENKYFSPGRVNLIGEHTDYNGGHVFPCAISNGTYGIASKNGLNIIRCYSMNFMEDGLITFDIKDDSYDKNHKWGNFVKGVVSFIQKQGYKISEGFDVLVYGNIPNGAGLSSSASLEILIGVIINDLYSLKMKTIELVKIGQEVENKFIGVNSGIMDQFAVAMGKKDKAIYLDTSNLNYELVSAQFSPYVILIMNTNKRRELTDSKYNLRREECEKALHILKKHIDIKHLGDLTTAQFENNKKYIDDDVLIKRAKHAISENERTILAKQALLNSNLEKFGLLLNESHKSLKHDYDITGVELDTLAESAQRMVGVLGARMTGAGMGGCAIALVHEKYVNEVIEAVQEKYIEKIGYAASFYIANVGDGAKKLL